jgi:hypothetical protein
MNELIAWGFGALVYVLIMWVLVKAVSLDKSPYENEQVDHVVDSAMEEFLAKPKKGISSEMP